MIECKQTQQYVFLIISNNKMQAQFSCNSHENQGVALACIDKNCKQARIFCNKCISSHPSHQIISYEQFRSKYGQYRKLSQAGLNGIKALFNKTKETFALCIKRAQQKITTSFLPICHAFLPTLDSLQAQQLFGLSSELCANDKFCALATSLVTKQEYHKDQAYLIQKLEACIDEMNISIMTAINQMMQKLALTISSKSNQTKSEIIQPNGQFKFSMENKPKEYQISELGKRITRVSQYGQGLTMYALIDQPLTKTNNSISFTIAEQKQRFIYLGVCDRETFKKFDFRGPVYQKGNKMYAIRQSPKQGDSAIALHNSIQQFSNTSTVKWDFQKGDIITLQYQTQSSKLVFINNSKLVFQMPLDSLTTNFYPFVGLKNQFDSVRIVKQGQSYIKSSVFSKPSDDKKSIFSSFFDKKQ